MPKPPSSKSVTLPKISSKGISRQPHVYSNSRGFSSKGNPSAVLRLPSISDQAELSQIKPGKKLDVISLPAIAVMQLKEKNELEEDLKISGWREKFRRDVLPQIKNVGPWMRYMQDNKARLDILRDKISIKTDFDERFFYTGTVQFIVPYTEGEFSHFMTSLETDTWKMLSLFKNKDDRSFYMSDIIVLEYQRQATMLRTSGFFGALPQRFLQCTICNPTAISVLNTITEMGEAMTINNRLDFFIKNTVNGASSKRVLDAFGLEAYDMVWDGSDVTLKVRKK